MEVLFIISYFFNMSIPSNNHAINQIASSLRNGVASFLTFSIIVGGLTLGVTTINPIELSKQKHLNEVSELVLQRFSKTKNREIAVADLVSGGFAKTEAVELVKSVKRFADGSIHPDFVTDYAEIKVGNRGPFGLGEVLRLHNVQVDGVFPNTKMRETKNGGKILYFTNREPSVDTSSVRRLIRKQENNIKLTKEERSIIDIFGADVTRSDSIRESLIIQEQDKESKRQEGLLGFEELRNGKRPWYITDPVEEARLNAIRDAKQVQTSRNLLSLSVPLSSNEEELLGRPVFHFTRSDYTNGLKYLNAKVDNLGIEAETSELEEIEDKLTTVEQYQAQLRGAAERENSQLREDVQVQEERAELQREADRLLQVRLGLDREQEAARVEALQATGEVREAYAHVSEVRLQALRATSRNEREDSKMQSLLAEARCQEASSQSATAHLRFQLALLRSDDNRTELEASLIRRHNLLSPDNGLSLDIRERHTALSENSGGPQAQELPDVPRQQGTQPASLQPPSLSSLTFNLKPVAFSNSKFSANFASIFSDNYKTSIRKHGALIYEPTIISVLTSPGVGIILFILALFGIPKYPQWLQLEFVEIFFVVLLTLIYMVVRFVYFVDDSIQDYFKSRYNNDYDYYLWEIFFFMAYTPFGLILRWLRRIFFFVFQY